MKTACSTFFSLLGISLVTFNGAVAAEPVSVSRPNIVVIMADDLGYSDLGCYGGEIPTPNLDQLAAEGMRFTQFYNNAVCIPTRASLMTGLYPRRIASPLTTNMVTVAELLRAAGYQTALSGKWHLRSQPPHRPIDRGFGEFYGLMDGACNYFNPVKPEPAFKQGRIRVFGHNDQLIRRFPEDFYTTDAFTDHAVETIRRFSGNGRPFLLHVAYTAPHFPLHARPEDIERFKGRYKIGWEEVRRLRHQRQVALGLTDPKWKLPPPDPEVPPWSAGETGDWQDLRMAVYAAMVYSLDRGIGRVLQALKETGAETNTLVLFFSDNGGCSEEFDQDHPGVIPGGRDTYTTCGPGWAYAQNTPFRRYKLWAHEGGIATPFIARWPGRIKPGSITRQVAHVIDLMPTCLELTGATYPREYNGNSILPLDGLSLVPVLEGKTRRGHKTLYWEVNGNRAIRHGDWKLSWETSREQWELYNLKADRTEMDNLASKQPARVSELAAFWNAWSEKTGGWQPKAKSSRAAKPPQRNN